MRISILAILLCLVSGATSASEEGPDLDKAYIDPTNQASLQHGAQVFVNYCLSCHSAAFMRYSRMGHDLGLSDKQVMQNLMFASQKIGEPLTVAMPADQAKRWFGTAPPDLSVVARARGVDWLYTYLRAFYLDDSRPFGVNNLVFKDVAMPHVLGTLQGWQKPVYRTETGEDGKERKVIEGLELAVPGSQSPEEYDRTVRDLVNFLAYMGEPAKLERQSLGIKVVLFLVVFLIPAYLLKKEYWKDVH